LILTMMPSCASEAPGGGPILSVGIDRQVRIRLPATSDRQFGSRAESQRERRKWC
jgi:hypothetical protein